MPYMAGSTNPNEWLEELEHGRRRQLERVESLYELRTRRGFTQQEIAFGLGVLQSKISRIEARENMSLRALQGYVGALRGQLVVVAVFGSKVFELDLLGPEEPPPSG